MARLLLFINRQQETTLVLQLHFMSFSMTGSCFGLMMASPSRPEPDEGHTGFWIEDKFGEEALYFWCREQPGEGQRHAVLAFRIALIGLPKDCRRWSAASLARKAAAAMTRVMWRCHPCQDRASQ